MFDDQIEELIGTNVELESKETGLEMNKNKKDIKLTSANPLFS
jgi:hypothetical protein